MKKVFLASTVAFTLTVVQAFSQCSVSISATNISCNGNADGTATANPSGGTTPYTYLWNPTSQTSQTATGLAAGNYTVTVTDAIACTATASAVVTQPSPFFVFQNSTPAGCGVNNGTATANVVGGTPPYTYLWTPTGQTTQTATGLTAGTYTISVTDNNNCTIVSIVSVTSPNTPTISDSSTPASSCSTCDGTATANPSGGTSPYTYLWTPTGQITQTATGLCIGTYTSMVTDANGCSQTNTVNVTCTNGIPNSSMQTDFSISPNPFSTQTTLHTDNPLHNAILTVVNCFGQTVAQIKNISGQIITLHRDNLPSGLYFIRLTQDNKTFATDKLVITDN